MKKVLTFYTTCGSLLLDDYRNVVLPLDINSK